MLLSSRRASSAAVGLLALALAAGSVSVVSLVATAPTAEAAGYTTKGIDVASWQHPDGKPIDWAKVRGAGYSFAIIKATESTTYANPYYRGDLAGAQAQGLVVGAYHFARPQLPLSSADDQARYLVRTIGNQQLAKTFPPVLDIESTGGLSKTDLETWMKRFLSTVRVATGRTPMIYSYDNFLRTKVNNIASFSGYPLWYANYTSKPPATLPGSWSGFRLWQHSSSGSVPGISGKTDLNWFAGTYSMLLSFASGRVPARLTQTRTQSWEPTYITGRVDPAYANERIVRQTRTKKGWRTTSTKYIRSDGTYSFMVRPAKKTTQTYRLYLLSNTPYARVMSKDIKVTVTKPWISVSTRKTLERGKLGHIKGRVDAFYAGEKVVRQNRTASGRWITKSTKRVAKNGTFDFGVRPTARTKHSYRVLLRATGPKAYKTSRTVTIRVT